MRHLLLYLIIILFSSHDTLQAQTKPRTIVTTDGEIDDIDSYIRMLLFSNEYNLEGLIYSSSMWHYKGDDKGTMFTSEMEMTKNLYGSRTTLRWMGTEWMNDLLNAYEKIYSNLIKHADGYPTPKYLKGIVRVGNIDFEGEMEKITEGSEFIKDKLMTYDNGPIYLQAWGGCNTISRALKSIDEMTKHKKDAKSIKNKISKNTIIYIIMGQDATYENYISKEWPDIKILFNQWQFGAWAYDWKKTVPASMHYTLEGAFMGNEIINDHGPLNELYYSYGDQKNQEGDEEHYHGDPSKIKKTMWGDFNKYDFISEGDSPAFFHLIDVGLDNLNNPTYGGWGGRFKLEKKNKWTTENVSDFNIESNKEDFNYPQSRWIESMQHEFAVRSDWCIKEFNKANHAPSILVKKKKIKAKARDQLNIKCKVSDVDKDNVNVSFWQYTEAGNTKEQVEIFDQGNSAIITIPNTVKKGDEIHIIVEAKDDNVHPLSRYQRIIIEIK